MAKAAQVLQDQTDSDDSNIPEGDGGAEGSRTLDPQEAARILRSMAGFMRKNAVDGDKFAEDLDTAANMADVQSSVRAAEEEAGEEGRKNLPKWAEEIEGIDKVFVEPNLNIRLWEAISRPIKGKNKVEVYYQHQDELLSPGRTKEEQGIALENIDNVFSLDEWRLIAEPILDRYKKALEIGRLSRVVKRDREQAEAKIKKILPQVFRADEIPDIDEVDMASQEFKNEINELITGINSDPEMLKGWIKEALLEEEAPKVVSIESFKAKQKRDQYIQMRQGEMRKRLMSRFKKEETDDINDYIERLAEKISRIGLQMSMLNKQHREGLYSSAKIKPDFVETPHIKDMLHQLTESAARQITQKKGMISMVGDMGTGKNYIVEHFAAKTNRPFFYFPCSRGMDAADLGFHFEFREGESFVVPSNLAKGLKTPNACILIDEPNALPAEVIAALHGLADHNRSFVYNGVEFKAAPGVVIMMTMNPATYAHVKDLPEAFSDRTLGQDLVYDYPPLNKLDQKAQKYLWSEAEKQNALQEDNSLNKEFVCDEALILRNVFPQMKREWSDEDFVKLWDVIINGKGESVLGDRADEAEQLRPNVEAIFQVLKVCDAWRKQYKKEEMNRTISLRGSIAVMQKVREIGDVRKAFLDLYKPNSLKYDGGREDYESLEQVMNDLGDLQKIINNEVTPS